MCVSDSAFAGRLSVAASAAWTGFKIMNVSTKTACLARTPGQQQASGAAAVRGDYGASFAIRITERRRLQKILRRFERERLTERKRMQRGHSRWLARNQHAQLDTRSYARDVDRLKRALRETVDGGPARANGSLSADQQIRLATRRYCHDLQEAVARSMGYVARLTQNAQSRQEKHNLALAVFDEEYAAHVERLEAELDRLAVAIAAASWERKQSERFGRDTEPAMREDDAGRAGESRVARPTGC